MATGFRDGHSPAEPGAGSAHGRLDPREYPRLSPTGRVSQNSTRELRETGGWGARLLPVRGARQNLDGMSRKPIRSRRRRREVRRRRGRHQAGHVLGGGEYRTHLGVPGILQVMDGMDGALAREDRE